MLSYTFKRKKAKRPLLLLAKRPKSRTQGNVRLSRCAAGKKEKSGVLDPSSGQSNFGVAM